MTVATTEISDIAWYFKPEESTDCIRIVGDDVIVPAGEYILGDPCYAVPNEHWDDFVTDLFKSRDGIVGSVLGHEIVAFSTAYGDGVYEDADDFEYGVDAGMIGLVPASLPGAQFAERFQKHVTFTKPTRCWRDGPDRGILHFGDITIDTVQDDDDEDVCGCCGRGH